MFHDNLVQVAQSVPRDRTLDVLMVGDFVTEHRMGTNAIGKIQTPKESYDKLHYPDTARLQGQALGAGGDMSYELLWHLQHGTLPANVQPRSTLLRVGINDLGRVGCSR